MYVAKMGYRNEIDVAQTGPAVLAGAAGCSDRCAQIGYVN